MPLDVIALNSNQGIRESARQTDILVEKLQPAKSQTVKRANPLEFSI